MRPTKSALVSLQAQAGRNLNLSTRDNRTRMAGSSVMAIAAAAIIASVLV
jgi:hypothetical protein